MGSGLGVQGLGSRVYGLGSRAQGLGLPTVFRGGPSQLRGHILLGFGATGRAQGNQRLRGEGLLGLQGLGFGLQNVAEGA